MQEIEVLRIELPEDFQKDMGYYKDNGNLNIYLEERDIVFTVTQQIEMREVDEDEFNRLMRTATEALAPISSDG